MLSSKTFKAISLAETNRQKSQSAFQLLKNFLCSCRMHFGRTIYLYLSLEIFPQGIDVFLRKLSLFGAILWIYH